MIDSYSLYSYLNTIMRKKAKMYLNFSFEIVEGYWIRDLLIIEFFMILWISSDGDEEIIFLMSRIFNCSTNEDRNPYK